MNTPNRSQSAAPTPTGGTDPTRPDPAIVPPVDVIEDASGITLYADLPGVPREALHLRVDGDQLSIEGEARVIAPAGLEISHAEVALPRYRRTFTLSRELDSGRIAAEMSHGVLRVRIPRASHTQPRRIEVQVQ